MTLPWRDDPPESRERIRQNFERLIQELARSARGREVPTVELARGWHRAIFAGVELPVAYYAGGIRDSDAQEPELLGHEVMWGGAPATTAAEVWPELQRFERAAAAGVDALDEVIEAGAVPTTAAAMNSALALAAALHNEWVRIHPHANGNGRVARCWANWVLLRYSLPPVVRLMPRPDNLLYMRAAALARQGIHGPMQRFINYLLRGELAGLHGDAKD